MSDAPAGQLPVPLPVLRAFVVGRKVWCAGIMFFATGGQVRALCSALAATDLPDCAVSVSFDGGPAELLIESFRDTAAMPPLRDRARRNGALKARASV